MANFELSSEDRITMELFAIDPDNLTEEDIELWERSTPKADEMKPVDYSEDTFAFGPDIIPRDSKHVTN